MPTKIDERMATFREEIRTSTPAYRESHGNCDDCDEHGDRYEIRARCASFDHGHTNTNTRANCKHQDRTVNVCRSCLRQRGLLA